MEQVLINTPTTLRESWYVDGVIVDPGTVTVTVTRADGTVLVTTAATSSGTGAAARTYNLLTTYTGQLDRLRIDWASSTHGTLTSYIEVVGAFYFSVSEFKARYSSDSKVQDLSADTIARARQTAEEIIERACHVAFVPRAKHLTLSGDGRPRLGIPLYRVRRVSAYSINGAAGDIAVLSFEGSSVFRTSWPRGFSNVGLTVEYGYDYPPEWLKQAAMTLAFHRAIKGPIDDRATSIPAGEAGGVITLLTPGVGAAITGIPEVDAAIIAHRLPAIGSVSSVPTTDSANTYPSNLDTFAIG